MYTLLISIAALILGYLLYGKFVDKVFAPDPKAVTPAYSMQDGVDYVPMPTWKVFMIQFLNIAGTGPIFGAIMGMLYGPAAYLWIVFGCIFGGAVHDYMSGMLSVRHGGISVADYLDGDSRVIMRGFSVLLLLLVGAVFVYSPAEILGGMTESWFPSRETAMMVWVFIVMAYYIIATLVPIDKIIGKIYPLFAFSLIFMAVALVVCLFAKWPADMPELWDGLANRNPKDTAGVFPGMFISIACGAVSGFHATQSPLMARCLKNEKLGRPVFYGAMITEGIIALIWATVASWFFFAGGAEELGVSEPFKMGSPAIVNKVCGSWLGVFGSILALLGVVAAPITSGDTALRSARLIIADAFKLDQSTIKKRLSISIPIFVLTGGLLCFNIMNSQGFNIIWRYFGWANQTLAIFTFWAITKFLTKYRKGCYFLISLIPACFMTGVCLAFIGTAKIGFNLPDSFIPYLGAVGFMGSVVMFFFFRKKWLNDMKRK